MPADTSSFRLSSFSDSPLRRAGFNITRTSTPRLCAAMTACRVAGSEKTNILMRNDRDAWLIASSMGRAESSGSTTNERDIVFLFPWQQQGIPSDFGRCLCCLLKLGAMQLRVNGVLRHEFIVGTTFRHHPAGNHDDLVSVT